MAKKIKDYYDLAYAKELALRIHSVLPSFDTNRFINLLKTELESLEFTQRQVLLAQSLHSCLDMPYPKAISYFLQILGPELEGSLGMFSEGYWLWPIGKYVELYGCEDFETTSRFSKELTKRFTGEFCMRPLLQTFPEETMHLLLIWSTDENKRVRRLASECMRIRLPWAKKSLVILDYFPTFCKILSNLKDDSDKTIQKSVANNLNDLYKEKPELFEKIITDWQKEESSPACAWIIKHASRTKEKENK